MARITKGNPYTHWEETRESWNNSGGERDCFWCGQRPRTLYEYNDSSENGRKLYCNKDCYNAYTR